VHKFQRLRYERSLQAADGAALREELAAPQRL
jgi:hypothetical protein